MPTYNPIDTGFPIKASASDLLAFQWGTNGVVADFIIPDDEAHMLRVAFDRPCIVRLLDEILDGARFSRSQSAAWKEISGPVTHYQFVTGWTCVDILSAGAPTFSVIA